MSLTKGRSIRNSDTFKAKGINVNFVKRVAMMKFMPERMRGVEDETYSCGTGLQQLRAAGSPADGNKQFGSVPGRKP